MYFCRAYRLYVHDFCGGQKLEKTFLSTYKKQAVESRKQRLDFSHMIATPIYIAWIFFSSYCCAEMCLLFFFVLKFPPPPPLFQKIMVHPFAVTVWFYCFHESVTLRQSLDSRIRNSEFLKMPFKGIVSIVKFHQ